MNLKIDNNQAEKIFHNLSDKNEQITNAWEKITTRFGKDVRCERIEHPLQGNCIYVCYLLNVNIDDNGELKKAA